MSGSDAILVTQTPDGKTADDTRFILEDKHGELVERLTTSRDPRPVDSIPRWRPAPPLPMKETIAEPVPREITDELKVKPWDLMNREERRALKRLIRRTENARPNLEDIEQMAKSLGLGKYATPEMMKPIRAVVIDEIHDGKPLAQAA